MTLNGHRFSREKGHLNDKIKAEVCFFRNFLNLLGKTEESNHLSLITRHR